MSQNKLEDPSDEQVMESKEDKKESVILQLGDVIRLEALTNEILNNVTFIIDYIDSSLIKLANVETYQMLSLSIHEDGVLGDGSITGVILVYRNDKLGYARQNNLLPGTWINLYFGGELPIIITGEITNLEEDMIEIKTYPDNDVIYINFGYKGLPLDIPIESIEIREPPEKIISEEEVEQLKPLKKLESDSIESDTIESDSVERERVREREGKRVVSNEIEDDLAVNVPLVNIKDQIREFIIRANDIQFGEEFGIITQYEDVDASQKRFTIEIQTNDLLDEMLSTVPNVQRTTSVLNTIHTMIERFKQLRLQFSEVDAHGNILSSIKKGVEWKPLLHNLKSFKTSLAWLLPVAKNIKKIYDDKPVEDADYSDIVLLNIADDIKDIKNIINQYRSDDSPDEQNKYITMVHELDPYFTPFQEPSAESENIIYQTAVQTDITAILDNLTGFESSVINQDMITTKKFVIQKYNLGLKRLETDQMTGSKMITHLVDLTKPDILAISSITMLSEPVIRYSRIGLPCTNILDKSNLNMTPLNYWQLLTNNTSMKNIIIDNLDEKLSLDEDDFVQGNKNYVFSSPEYNIENYTRFLSKFIPKTRVLFNMIKKYIHGKLSLVDVVSTLEPFLVYIDDITFKQYEEMNTFIIEKIAEYNTRFAKRGNDFNLLKRISKESVTPSNTRITKLINDPTLFSEVFEKYDFPKTEYLSNSETILQLTKDDCSRLYDSALSLENLHLMIPENIDRFIDEERDILKTGIERDEAADVCKTYVLAKQYKDLEELEADNDKMIYFDKKYDNTLYSILDEYKKDQMMKTPEEFKEFLIDKLIKKHGASSQYADLFATTLIQGIKRVENGHYAIVYDNNSETAGYLFFKRENNNWVLDATVSEDMLSNDATFLCNFQENCVEVSKKYEAVCQSESVNKKTLVQNALKEMVNQFDKTYQINKVELEKQLQRTFEYNLTIFDTLRNIEIEKKYKYNFQQVRLGLKVDEEGLEQVASPYKNIRDIILGQTDFVKKQVDIVKFSMRYTREAIRSANEDEHWRYCIETNTKLLPLFLYELAGVWCETPDEYSRKVDLLIKEIGALSDDGDSWVDKYSGYVIKQIDFDIDEGYEEGYKAISRSVLEQDAGSGMFEARKVVNDSPMTKMINNIINAVSGFMGISIEDQKEFIIKVASTEILAQLPLESDYKIKIDEMGKKGKAIASYKQVYNLTVLYMSLGALLIGIQTSIPSVRTRKTFPGCVRSFDGFPFQGNGDFSAVHYLACVVYKIRNKTDPWSALVKSKEESVFEKIKAFIETYLLKNEDVVRKMQEKIEYLLTNPPVSIPKEHELSTWLGFLPPLVRIVLKPFPQNISKAFKDKLMQEFKSGARSQRENILVIESKMIQFSLAIQEKIQTILDKKKLLLTNATNEPFLENACCNEREKANETVIQYFEKEDKDIELFNTIVKDLSHLLYDIQRVSKAPFFLSRVNTKKDYPPSSNDFNEDTIYQAFIVLCKFNTAVPITPDLIAVCTDKPDYLNLSDSISEKIRKLKEDGRNYTNESMLRLIQVVSKNNIITVHFDEHSVTLIQKLRDVLEAISREEDEVVNKSMIQHIEATLDTFDIGVESDSEEMRSLKNYASRSNTEMKKEIIEFLGKNGGLSKNKMKAIAYFIENVTLWETSDTWRNQTTTISDDATYNSLQFMKEYMQNMIKVFPKIILDKVDYQNIQLPRYWGLSNRHMEDIKQSILEYYGKLRTFYDSTVLKNVLLTISSKCDRLLMLALEIPYLSEITWKNKSMHSIFDKRTVTLLMENFFLQTLTEYIHLANDPAMIVRTIAFEPEEEFLTLEEMEDRERGLSAKPDSTLSSGEQKQLRVKVSELLISFLTIMEDHKDIVDLKYDRVMDLVFKTKEREKDTFTDRLKALTDEERDADTILKINKLGVWSKGLQKGLTTYTKETYDEERDFAEKLAEIENKVKRSENVTEQNLEQYMEDFMEEQEMGEQIEQEELNMGGLTEDYMDGDYFGQEEEHFDDYN
uniref:Uncharacterized protein n=1 Tax=viral metagenome TaxID=1070528 RepID=A0A6C0BA64_9ZZZZ